MPSPLAGIASPRGRPLPSGAPLPIGLVDAVAIALRDNRSIRSAYLSRISQKFDLFLAERSFRPRADIAASALASRLGGVNTTDAAVTPSVSWRTPTGATVQFTFDRQYQLSSTPYLYSDLSSLTVTQPLLRGAGIDVNLAPVRIARLQERFARLQLQSTVSATVTAVILAYRALLQAQEQDRLVHLSLDRTRQLLDTNRALIDAGRMAAADIVQTQAQVANQEVTVSLAAQQVRTSQLALLQLLAADLRINIVAADPIAADHVDIDTERVVASGLASRMDVQSQRLAVEQSRQLLLVAKNDRLLDVSFVATANRPSGRSALVEPDGTTIDRVKPRINHSIGIQLDIPIGQPERRQGEINATVNLRTAELNYEQLSQAAEAQLRDAIQTVEANWKQLQTAKRARELSQQTLDLEREKLKAGRASNFEVLSFESDLRAADTQQLSAAVAYLDALTTLDEQAGSTLDTWHIGLND